MKAVLLWILLMQSPAHDGPHRFPEYFATQADCEQAKATLREFSDNATPFQPQNRAKLKCVSMRIIPQNIHEEK